MSERIPDTADGADPGRPTPFSDDVALGGRAGRGEPPLRRAPGRQAGGVRKGNPARGVRTAAEVARAAEAAARREAARSTSDGDAQRDGLPDDGPPRAQPDDSRVAIGRSGGAGRARASTAKTGDNAGPDRPPGRGNAGGESAGRPTGDDGRGAGGGGQAAGDDATSGRTGRGGTDGAGGKSAARTVRQTAPRPTAPPRPAADGDANAGATGKDDEDLAGGAERDRAAEPLSVGEISLIANVLGVPPAAAVGVAAAFTAIGVAVDLLRTGTLGTVFTICFVSGCVFATAWVRRNGLFWPMVTPPLLMALAVPVVVLVAGTTKPGAGVAQRLLVIGAPLVNGFPMMAWTTGLVLALGLFRLVTQRLNPRPRGKGAARAGGRT